MILAQGARGPGFSPRMSATPGNAINLSQQLHNLIAYFSEIIWKKQYVPQMIKKTYKLEHTDYQLLTTIFMR